MMAIAFDRTHGGNAPAEMLDFSASLNPLGPPPAALEAYQNARSTIAAYPEPYAESLLPRLADFAGVQPENVVAGNGSVALFYLLARVLRPRRPFVAVPTFSEIANALIVAGAPPEPVFLPRDRGFEFSAARFRGALEAGADAIFIGRPNSPTGTMMSLDEVRDLAGLCARHACSLVIDEAFIELAEADDSSAPLVKDFPTLVVVRSLTKLFAIPGLRLGYLIGSGDLAAALARALEPWSVNSIALAVAGACLREPADFIARSREVVHREREFVTAKLAAAPGLTVFSSVSNFVMLQAREPPDIPNFAVQMRQRGIVTRDLRHLPGCQPGDYRIGLRQHADNERLASAAAQYRPD